MLSCTEYMVRHSEYLDGLLAEHEAQRWHAHESECPKCARYTRVLRFGLKLLREQPAIEPTHDLLPHLYGRMWQEDSRRTLRPMGASTLTAVSVAAAIAFMAWLPVVVFVPPAETPTAAQSTDVVLDASEIAWHGTTAAVTTQPSHVRQTHRQIVLQGAPLAFHTMPTYSPLVVDPPIAPPSYTRTVSTQLLD